MRVHLTLLGSDGRTLKEESFDSSVVTVGAYEHAMFLYAGLPRLEIQNDGYHATARALSSKTAQRLLRRNLIPLGNEISLRVELYPRPDAVPRRRGACPACGDDLVERQSGGAYRSVAKAERGCQTCGAIVLTLDGARKTHGHFSDRSEHDLVAVMVSGRCPKCLESMSRAKYVFERREIDVECCTSCELVVLDREDQALLGQ